MNEPEDTAKFVLVNEPEDTAKFVLVNCQIFANYWNLSHYIKNMQGSKAIATLIVKVLKE